ncbi:LAFA_0A04324g1_1 [Lachancea sp. 'fantastica']|nr:LAFA_0A04324g1_1 [Lachancea sp. 'fantastica']
MKLIPDLKVSRKELQDWADNLSWAPDGTLYITTVPDLTVCQPVYEDSNHTGSKGLFHVKEYPLPLKNKLEFMLAQDNTLLNSIPDSFVKRCEASPITNLLAVLTNNGNACIFEDDRLLFLLDEPDRELKNRTYHSLAWSPCGRLIAVGNECGEVVTFKITDGAVERECEHQATTKVVDDLSVWVTRIKWSGQNRVVALSDNSVFLIKKDSSIVRLIEPSRFSVFDFCAINDSVVISRMGSIFKYDVLEEKTDSLNWSGYEKVNIVPIPERRLALLLSSKMSCLVDLDQRLNILEDKLVGPHLEMKFKRWNSYFNELNNYETSLSIHGLSTSSDGASLAILYSIDRLSLRYRIVSEQVYRICFLPLSETWQIRAPATGLAWFQTYQIYGRQLPLNFSADVQESELDTTDDFKTYLQKLVHSEGMNTVQFSNYINEVKDNLLYKKAVYDYAAAHSAEITNELDRACVQAIAQILGLESPVKIDKFCMKSELIEESFNLQESAELDVIYSGDGHVWRRCAATFLPLLTPKVKICPVSKFRIIDVKKDSLNDYGFMTRTILEVFCDQSIYTGTKMI